MSVVHPAKFWFKIGNSGFRVMGGAGMRYTYEYPDSNFLESTSFFLSRELYLIMEDSHTRYGLIVSVGCGDPGSGNARARAKITKMLVLGGPRYV